VKYCLTGAAPVSVDVINFMRCALGVVFTEGELDVVVGDEVIVARFAGSGGEVFDSSSALSKNLRLHNIT